MHRLVKLMFFQKQHLAYKYWAQYLNYLMRLVNLILLVHLVIAQWFCPHFAEFELQTEGQYLQLIEIIELDERLLLLGKDERNERLTYRWIE